MIRRFLWWLLMAVCLVVAGVLVPLFTVVAALTTRVFNLMDLANQERLNMRLRRGRLW